MLVNIIILIDILVTMVTDDFSSTVSGAKVTNRRIFVRYLFGSFVFDLASCLPGLLTLERYSGQTIIYSLKMFRLT